MGSHCGRPIKPKSKPKNVASLKYVSPSSSHVEKTTDPHELHDSSPHFLQPSEVMRRNFGSKEDVRKAYQIEQEVVGKGHFSTVRRAVLAGFDRPQPVQFCLKSVLTTNLEEHIKELLGQELEILKTMRHPRVVRFFEAFQDSKFVHSLTEYLPGGDLLSYLAEQPDGRLTEQKAKSLMFSVFSTVSFLHRHKVVHRDLKPENLLFDSDHECLKLIDFGLSKKDDISEMRTIVGSPYYIAPEIIRKQGYDSSSDVWSLGVILFLVLQRTPPFFSNDLHELFTFIETKEVEFTSPVSDEAKDLIVKMLRKNPKERLTIKEAIKHPFFHGVSQEHKRNCDLEELRNVIVTAKNNSTLFTDEMRTLRHLFLEFGLQFLNPIHLQTLENFYLFFDPKLKGEVSTRSFGKGLKALGLNWPETEITGLFRDYNSAFQCFPGNKTLGYHEFQLMMIGNVDVWLENTWKGSIGTEFDKGWVKKCFERRLMRYSPEDLELVRGRELIKRLIGREEELGEENGVERIEVGSSLKYFM